MSGRPSWALYEPSANSTSECTTLWGWITASILEYGSRYNHRASMTSNALLTNVAESIVIFGPIRHVGCASASSAVTDASCAASRPRNGPPLAVRTRRSTTSIRSPTRHCQIAECSLSTGRSRSSGSPPMSSSSAATRCPPVTRVSLFASATRLPARSAASTAGRAVMPVVATTTMSTSSAVASSSSPPAAQRVSRPAVVHPVPRLSPAASRQLRAEAVVGVTGCEAEHLEAVVQGGHDLERLVPDRPGRAQDARPVTPPARRPAARSRRAPGRRRGTSRSGRGCRRARDQKAGLLAPCGTLEHRLRQVAGLGSDADDGADDQGMPRLEADQHGADARRRSSPAPAHRQGPRSSLTG